MASPQSDFHDDRREVLAEGVDVRERLTWSRIEVRDQEPCSRIARHMCCRSSSEIDADEDVDDGTTEGTDPGVCQ